MILLDERSVAQVMYTNEIKRSAPVRVPIRIRGNIILLDKRSVEQVMYMRSSEAPSLGFQLG